MLEQAKGYLHPLNLCRFASTLALFVVVVGAYTRLSDSGLGCPDWPGCYGQIIPPADKMQMAGAFAGTPPVEADKAWIEMIHRYIAGGLGLMVFALSIQASRYTTRTGVKLVGGILTLLVVGQALLGMWTVTMRLYPIVVMGHLMGGLTILGLLWWVRFQFEPQVSSVAASIARSNVKQLHRLGWMCLVMLCCQVALGGWTSANYAALVCEDFPTCQGALWPQMDWVNAFNLMQAGIFDSPGAPLQNSARVTIQVAHRLGALITSLLFGVFIYQLFKYPSLRRFGVYLLVGITVQISLGITNVLAQLPMWSAVMHNGMAAVLIICVVRVLHALGRRSYVN